MRNFASFHVHPQSLDTGSTPEAFVDREVELGTGSVTCTDHGTLTACWKIYERARKKKIIPILGLEGYFRDDDCPILAKHGVAKVAEEKSGEVTYKNWWNYGHLTMHFLDQVAYERGVRVLSRAALTRAEANGSERKPLFSWSDLEELLGPGGVTLGSGCLVGMVQRHLLDHDAPQIAIAHYERMRSLVPAGNFYVEIFPHKCDKNWDQGVYVTLAGGETLRWYPGKKVRTDKSQEIAVSQLAKEQPKTPHGRLLAVKNYQTWTELEPREILEVRHVEDFIPNECRPWCPNGDVQAGANQALLWLARKYGDPVVVSDDAHFARPEDKAIQDARLAQSGSWRFYGSYHRQTSVEALEHFQSTLGIGEAEFESWVENSLAWASRFKDFKLEYKPELPTRFYPQDTLGHTFELIQQHGRMRWGDPTYKERLGKEIELLHKNGKIDLLPYFFVSEEVSKLYQDRGLLTGPGRGSAAGLLLAYLLEITHVDPLEHGLSLERFITMDRIRSGKLPDIDMDFPSRALLVDDANPTQGWLKERFGDHVAQISVDTKLKVKSAVKDACRARLGHVPPEVERLTHRFSNAPQGIDEKDFVFGYEGPEGHVVGAIESDLAIMEFAKGWPAEWALAGKMLGIPRAKGRHACAFAITNIPISDFLPLQLVSGVPVTQYTAEAVEAAGAVKYDFLVVNTLRDISACLDLIRKRSGLEIPDHLVLDGVRVPGIRLVPHDGRWHDVWKLYKSPAAAPVLLDVSEGKTETVFQFNTPGAVKYLKECFNREKPGTGTKAIDSLQAMSVFTALDRPGPLDFRVTTPDGKTVNMLEEYARRAGGESPAEAQPIFMRLFPETYGVMCYQEQLQRAYQELTGCSGPEAEEFRANVAKKKMAKVEQAYGPFVERAGAKIGRENAEYVWGAFKTFGQYGFNLAHSLCYSLIGFVCAYLKHWFPLEWWCSVLRNADKKEVSEKFWPHAGHLIDLPDINLSGDGFEIVGNRLKAPVDLLHGVGPTAHAELLSGRPYQDIQDFCDKLQARRVASTKISPKTGKPQLGRSALTRGVVQTLIVSGVMDRLFPAERVLDDGTRLEVTVLDRLEMYEDALAAATGARRAKVNSKFNDFDQIVRHQMRRKVLPAWSEPILPMLIERRVPGIIVQEDGRVQYRKVYDVEGEIKSHLIRFCEWAEIDYLDKAFWGGVELHVAAAAYVSSAKRWTYGASREGFKCVLDLDGGKLETVKWGGQTGLDDMYSPQLLEGAVVVALLSKRGENKPFHIDSLVVVRQGLGKEKEDDESEGSEQPGRSTGRDRGVQVVG